MVKSCKVKITPLFFFLLAFSIILLFILASSAFETQPVTVLQQEVHHFNDNWRLLSAEQSETTLTLPISVKNYIKKAEVSSLKNTLPSYIKDDSFLVLSTTHTTLQVFIDAKPVYHFGSSNQYLFSQSPAATAWHFIPLEEGYQDKEVTLQFGSPYQKYSGNYNAVMIGTKSSCLYYLISQNIFNILICFILLFMGVILFFIYFVARLKTKRNQSFLHLSMFTLLISIWSLTETLMLPLIFSNVFLLTFIPYFVLMLVPIPFLQFVKTTYVQRHVAFFDIICYLAIGNFLLCTALQVFRITDYTQTLFLTQIILFLAAICSLVFSLVEAFYFKKKSLRGFAFCMITIVIFFLLDLLRYYKNTPNGGVFLRISILIFVIVPAVDTVNKHYSMASLVNESNSFRKLAYTDILTQTHNRTAFDSAIQKIESARLSQITIAVFDVNNLKIVNDTYGHNHGDDLIINAATVIQNAFEHIGICYRIGGDEFAVIIANCNKETLEKSFKRLTQQLNNFNKNREYRLEIAYGFAHFEVPDENLADTFKRADLNMYQNKRTMKNDPQISLF